MLMLFDYDGVIVDSFYPLLELCAKAQVSLAHGRAPTAGDFQTIQNLTFDDLGRLIGIPEELIAAYSEKVFELQQASWQVSPFAGIVEVLSKLATQHTVAVITSSRGETVLATLQAFGLGSSVSKVMGGESGTSKAERIAEARSLYSFTATETFMVGDAISDVREGKKAGVQIVAVSWGFQNRDLLAEEGPDFLIDAPADLLSIAAGIYGSDQSTPRGDERA